MIVTARKRSCGKVMFLYLCVILFTGGISVQAVPLSEGSLSRGVSVQGVSVRGVSVWGVSVWGSVQWGLCPGGLCPWEGLCPAGLSKGGPLSGRPPCMVKSGCYASYLNAFLYFVCLFLHWTTVSAKFFQSTDRTRLVTHVYIKVDILN